MTTDAENLARGLHVMWSGVSEAPYKRPVLTEILKRVQREKETTLL